jgi:uncharacterized protein YdaU (DUF1376 family)
MTHYPAAAFLLTLPGRSAFIALGEGKTAYRNRIAVQFRKVCGPFAGVSTEQHPELGRDSLSLPEGTAAMAKDGLTVRPWYRWSPRDFLADPAVAVMDREQRWRYRDALDFSWLSDSPGRAAEDQWRRWLGYTAAEWDIHRERFIAAFVVDGISWTQKRMASELDHATETSRKRSDAGAKGQAALASKSRAFAEHLPGGCRADALERERGEEEVENLRQPLLSNPDGSDVSDVLAGNSKDRSGATNATPLDFGLMDEPAGPARAAQRSGATNGNGRPSRVSPKRQSIEAAEWEKTFHEWFWPEYPRHVAKASALKAWMHVTPTTQSHVNIINEGLGHSVREWDGREPDKIPHASTWLNQRRWEDRS